ncbi:ABC transporter ATP-binding protein [Actinophytocola sediminis]
MCEPAAAGTVDQVSTTTAAAGADGLTKVYGGGESRVVALDDVSVEFHSGRFTAIMGPSGSGKSTLMHCVAGLDTPSAGRVWLGAVELTGLADDELTALRRDRVGFVFQAFNLLPTLTALENIMLPLDLAGRRADPALVESIIDAVGLGDRLDHRPSQLSGGQQQRVACARALVTAPEVVFADEPTGALDSSASADLLALLRRGVDEFGRTVVMVTHEPAAAAYADHVLFLADGRLVDELTAPTANRVLDRMKSLERVA